ncbi:MAG TPA: hypothetical protein VME66_02705 [Candidatus Acidoferrales bacterium]|nr:hypothetical protein [Candidatus Acidoferrales bacterium]
MSTQVDPRDTGSANANAAALAVPAPLIPAISNGIDLDADFGNRLPSDHPAWSKDTISLSQRFRAIVAQCKPLAVRVLTFWDHHVRSILVGGRRLAVDASGSYRLE